MSRYRMVGTALAALVLTVVTVAVQQAAPTMAAPTVAAPTRIMPLGDSITGGPGCWRALLWDRLQRTGFTNIDLVGTLPGGGCSVAHDGDNEGHGGFLATGIANQNLLPGWLAATQPEIVLMHLGTNDVWNNVPTASIIAAFSTLVDQMRASNPGTKILVAQIIPMTPSGCTWCPPGVTALNNAIPGWAASKSTAQSPITVVDQFTGFDTVADTNGDGVHPDDSGFQKISDRWYPALTPLLTGGTPEVPGAPGTPVASGVTASSVSLMWTASTGTVTNYQIERCQGAACVNFVQVGTSTTTSFINNSGLTANTAYRYRVRATNASGASPYSGIVNVTTSVSTGCVPTNLQVTGTTPTSITLSWSPPPAPCNTAGYDVFRAPGASGGTFTLVGQPTNPPFTNTGLPSASTFRYQVRARDTQGNLGPFTPPVVGTTQPGGSSGCSATLTLQTGWGNGYVMQPNTVTNTGTSTINGWTVTFTLPAGHTITGFWNATVTVSGQTVTARGIAGQNATLGGGASTTWGFQATRPEGNTALPGAATCMSP